MSDSMLHIAEMFESVQGEGVWAGTPMLFIRLAGCNVGRAVNGNEVPSDVVVVDTVDPLKVLERRHTICTSVLGQRFICDTDYRTTESQSIEELHERIRTSALHHVCITGGEPLLQAAALLSLRTSVIIDRWCPQFHIETSGTVSTPDAIAIMSNFWVTCSPKAGFSPEVAKYVDEWKFVLDLETQGVADFVDAVVCRVGSAPHVFIQPINGIDMPTVLTPAHQEKLMQILHEHPEWRVSVQMHKFLNMR